MLKNAIFPLPRKFESVYVWPFPHEYEHVANSTWQMYCTGIVYDGYREINQAMVWQNVQLMLTNSFFVLL